jgi:hypothetical protein
MLSVLPVARTDTLINMPEQRMLVIQAALAARCRD